MLRSAAREFAYKAGAMEILRRARNRNCLTVVMFHRVLPAREQARVQPDPHYVVSPEFLSSCLTFFASHYSLVSLQDLIRSRRRQVPLPENALHITFDDGWRDNLVWALPVLRGKPWTVFVATDAAEEGECWWQEAILWGVRSGRSDPEELLHRAGSSHDVRLRRHDILELLLAYGMLSEHRRRELLGPEIKDLRAMDSTPNMMSAEDMQRIVDEGGQVALHGASHLPLLRLANPLEDILRAKQWLHDSVPRSCGSSISLPHGRYDERVLEAARRAGCELIFTSDNGLTPSPGGWLMTDVVGRIPISTQHLADTAGHLSADRLASWLYMRQRLPRRAAQPNRPTPKQ